MESNCERGQGSSRTVAPVEEEVSEKTLPTSYQKMKHIWDKEQCIERYIRNERNGVAWMEAGILELRGIKRGTGRSFMFREGGR
jgi:hypothetical protein